MMNNHESIVPILNLDDLMVISPLGRGAKGLVFLVKEKQYGELWALKVILRDLIEKKTTDSSDGNDYKRVCFERQVLSHFKHPLLPGLRGVLATDKIVGYAIDYCPGRDLNHLRKQQTERMFSGDIIRFYAAELVLVLEYLHNLGIAYRDLKPENILIQENGHIMLVDFDLSTKISPKCRENSPKSNSGVKPRSFRKRKFSLLQRFCNSGISPHNSDEQGGRPVPSEPDSDVTEKSNSFVGTEEYVAPEIIQGYGHDFAVDWWSLGVVLYEMLYGFTPFKGSNRKETFYKILTKPPDLVGATTPLRDLVSKLLVKNPKERIKPTEIKGHDFFQGINWDMLLQMSRPPHIPPASHEFWVKESKDGIMKIDVESFVQRIFGDEAGKQKEHEEEEDKDKDRPEKKQLDHQEENITDKRVWVKELDHSRENNNFLVF